MLTYLFDILSVVFMQAYSFVLLYIFKTYVCCLSSVCYNKKNYSLGPVLSKIKGDQIEVVVDQLCKNMQSDKEQLRSISGLVHIFCNLILCCLTSGPPRKIFGPQRAF